MDKTKMTQSERIIALENKVVDLQNQVYYLQGKPTPTSVNPYDLNQTRIRKNQQ